VTSEGTVADIEVVRKELEAFGHGLAERPWLAALNKIDLPGARERAETLRGELRAKGIDAHPISACTGEGIDSLVAAVYERVRREREVAAREPPEAPVVRVQPPERPTVRKMAGGFEVLGRQPREAVLKLGVDSDEAHVELVRRLRRMGVVGALSRAGVRAGDRVHIGEAVLEWPL